MRSGVMSSGCLPNGSKALTNQTIISSSGIRVRGLAVAVAAFAALLVTSASAGTPPLPAQKRALTAVNKALKSGRIDGPTAAAARGEIARAARLIRGLPNG